MKKLTIILCALFFCCLQSQAVLKEKDLDKTLEILHLELLRSYREQKVFLKRYEQMSTSQHAQLIDYMKQSEQISLMLYSQKSDFTFDVAYACTQASKLYNELNKTNLPYDKIRAKVNSEIARYDSLIAALKALPPSIDTGKKKNEEEKLNQGIKEDIVNGAGGPKAMPFQLDEEEQKDRRFCILYAKAMRENLVRFLASIEDDKQYYSTVTDKVGKLNDYSKQKYKDIQDNIFVDGGQNYFQVLMSLPMQIDHAKRDYIDKYHSLGNKKTRSQWRGPIVLAVSIFMLFYIIIATILSNLIVRWIPALVRKLFPKFAHRVQMRLSRSRLNYDPESYKQQQHIFVLALGIFLFAVAISIVNHFLYLNLFIMAASLMISFSWLIEAILVSLLIRLKPNQCNHGIAIYIPFIWMALIVIFFRIILIPNNLVNLICPPIIIGFAIWQYCAIRKHKKYLSLSDLLYSSISLIVLIASGICAWIGFTLFAVQVIIWWTFLLAAIETITCCYDLMEMYENNYLTKKIIVNGKTLKERKELVNARDAGLISSRMERGLYIERTWLYDFVNRALVPIASVISVLASIYFAADIFEMTSACTDFFKKLIIDEPKYIQVSLYKVTMIAVLFFIFKYVNYAFYSLYHMFKRRRAKETGEDFNATLAKNIFAIIIWCIYAIIVLVILRVPQTGISVVAAGLATGMGFAMKDLLENFFYGISLMSGRLRVGDYIECDGIQGKVESITYQSTQIITLDGSVIAFLNTSLFNKNFKNLTRNHSYELVKVPVGVAYGTNVEQVRQMLTAAIEPLFQQQVAGEYVANPEKGLSVLFSNFGDSSVDLVVAFWVLVDKKNAFIAKVKEVIYETLNANNIEIPFPQQDIYIHSIANKSDSSSNN